MESGKEEDKLRKKDSVKEEQRNGRRKEDWQEKIERSIIQLLSSHHAAHQTLRAGGRGPISSQSPPGHVM